jgi:hypothetical protein
MVVLVRNPGNPAGLRHYVTGADALGGVTFSENAADALLFTDAAAAAAFSSGKNIQGAQQVVVTGIKNAHTKTCT